MTIHEVAELDPTAIGDALMKLAVISRLLGHEHIALTAQDYLSPNDSEHRTPEWRFVLELVTAGKTSAIDAETAVAILQGFDLPEPELEALQ